MHRPTASPLRHALAAALALAAAACADQPTAPARTAPPTTAATIEGAASGRPQLIANRTRYRDRGFHPTTGRSGSASLTTRALLGRDGNTELEVSTSYWIDDYWADGRLTQVQTKAFDPEGKHMRTFTHARPSEDGKATFTYRGLARGAKLQTQAVIHGIDPRRADVVTVDETVRLRPNLRVVDVTAPARVRSDTWTNVSAIVAETNGDVGVETSCGLYVDGQLADWAYWVWVDAGDRVTCAFSHRFTGDGKKRVEVRLGDISPRDDDPADNTASVEVEVVGNNELYYWATFSDRRSEDYVFSSSKWEWPGVYADEYGFEETYSTHERSVVLYAWMHRDLGRPLPRVQVTERTGGAVVHQGEYQVTEDYGGADWACGSAWDGAAGAHLYLCTYAYFGETSVSYERYAGQVVYHGSSYSRVWDGLTGEEYVYSYNYVDAFSWGGGLGPLGSDYQLSLRLIDGGNAYTADAVMPLSTSEGGYHSPRECWSWEDWDGFRAEDCWESRWSYHVTRGYARNY
jgi:hypothetical protein